jgi:hypothetical protein
MCPTTKTREYMSTKAKTETELQAWDQYAAAAIHIAYSSVDGRDPRDFVLKATKRAAEIADELLEERRRRS